MKKTSKEAGDIQFNIFLVDLIGTCKIIREGYNDPLLIKSLTMIGPATGWFDIVRYHDKQAANIDNLAYQTWLYRYPRPVIITYDRGN